MRRALAAALCLGLWLELGGAAAAEEPAIGRLLLATPQVSGFFAESVIVLADHGAHGSLGLIVNRPIASSVAELLPDFEEAKAHTEPAWLGGPVATTSLLLLVRAKEPPAGAVPVLAGVSVSGSRATLRALLAKPPPGTELRAYVGYTGWSPGQLASEITRGDWLVLPTDAATVFTRSPDRLWGELTAKHRSIEVNQPETDGFSSVNLAGWRARQAPLARN